MYGALAIAIILFYFANKFSKRIRRIVSKNKKDTIPFGRSIVAGMISGVIVIALDRIINQWIQNRPTLDTSSLYNFFLSITGVIIISFLMASFLLFIIFYLIQKGVVEITRKK
mgnify:CR=1 FL=1